MPVTNPPGSYINWVPSGNPAYIVQPTTGQSTTGWVAGEYPPFQYMNYLFYILDNWVQYLDYTINVSGKYPYDVIVGSEPFCTDATLAAAVANGAHGPNQRVLLVDSATLSATVHLTKAGWHIDSLPGVTYTYGAGTTGLSMEANDIRINILRMVNFPTAIVATSAGTYCRVMNCNFNTCTNEVDDSSAPAGRKTVTLGNITE